MAILEILLSVTLLAIAAREAVRSAKRRQRMVQQEEQGRQSVVDNYQWQAVVAEC